MEEEVSVESSTLGQLFIKKLTIPEYQRIYSWQEKNVFFCNSFSQKFAPEFQ